MTLAALDAGAPLRVASWRTIFRLGTRELRGGLKGFGIFIACLALGVMVIAAVGALGDAMRAGFAKQGETILGGDVTFARMHIRATDVERKAIDGLGLVSETSTMRTMARRLDGNEQALTELKSVDERYPLSGSVVLEGGVEFKTALTGLSAVADAMLLERLGLKPGDKFKLGEAEVEIRGVLKSEPDGVADRLTYGPRVFVSLATLEKTALAKPGTLIRWRYAVTQPEGAPGSREDLKALRASMGKLLPDTGFSSVDRYDPSPQVTRTLDRLRQFLILIGLASLLIGGVGIANSVATFIGRRVKVIAILRSVGASGTQVFGIFLVQILAMSLIGIAIGLAAGAAIPGIIDRLYGDALPVRAEFSLSPKSLTVAGLYGFLVALLFALWPLGRTEHVRASVLFRDAISQRAGWPRPAIWVAMAVIVALLFALAFATSEPKSLVFYVAGGLALMLTVFSGLGSLVARLARRMPRSSWPPLALAVRNIGAPDGLTRSVVLSLGTGLSLLVAVALANSSLVEELRGRLPDQSPDYFLLDVPKTEYPALAARLNAAAPGVVLTDAPMLRGRLLKLKDMPVEQFKPPADAQWVLNGDRGLSYTNSVPEGSKVIEGSWWAADYSGPPLVSFDQELAQKLGLKIGDHVTVSVLGRTVEATIANLREIKWESLAINFVMVFSPNTLRDYPHNFLATIRLPKGLSRAAEVALVRDLGQQFPSVSAIRVRDAIDQVNKVFAKIMTAVQAAGSVTLLAGALVLAGALATAQRRRILEAVILKTIGAQRRQILAAHALEYTMLAGVAALVAIALGTIIAWIAVTQIMDLDFAFSLNAVFLTLAAAGGLIAVFGGLGTFAVLRARPVPYLRSE
ncbi:MAG: FtsX-like permease family protein [Hyphomicrobium sp.]|nr:FtsX-like permease family protein [Hyphomicrobium sp.]